MRTSDRSNGREGWDLVFVIPNLGVGGLERGTAALVKAAIEQGLRAAVVTLTDPRVEPSLTLLPLIESMGATVCSLRLKGLDLYRHPARLAVASRRLQKLLANHRPRVVVSAILDADLPARIAARVIGASHCSYLVSTTYDDRMRHGPRRRRAAFRLAIQLERWTSVATAQYIALTDTVATQARELIRIPPARVSVIGRGVDLKQFHPPRDIVYREELLVVALGRLVPQKNHVYLIEGLSSLDHQVPLKAAIYGEGPLLEPLRELAGQRGLDSLALPGPTAEPEVVLQAADVFVLPSLIEGQSNSLLEAMASGCVLVLADIPVLREVAGDTAFYVDLSNPSSLASQLLRIVELEPEERRDIGMTARQRAEALYDADVLNRRALDVILSSEPPPTEGRWPRR